jgi:ClpP class serine protease
MMCRHRFKSIHVIVVNYAKSAATMIALGSDKICMGYLAELGPIDPQIQVVRPDGRIETIPAIAFIDGLRDIRKRIVEKHDPPEMYLPMIAQIRPEIITICNNAIEDAKSFAAKWLGNYMLKNDPEWAKKVAEFLTTGEKYKSHGKVIDYHEAKNVLKLNVDLIDEKSELWNKLWELYVRGTQYLQITNQAKLFENEKTSIAMQIGISPIQGGRSKQ